MKKTISINISSTAFFIDEDAYEMLNQYLSKLNAWFIGKEGGREIINDIENRLSELFSSRINPKTGVITIELVTEVIEIMGQPEDFVPEGEAEEERTSGKENEESASEDPGISYKKNRRFYRNVDDSVIGGVCSGIAAYFNLDPVLVRVIFAILPFLSFGVIIPIYIILWIAMPPAITISQKMEMRGENINISNIEKNIKEQYNKAREQFSHFRESKTYKDGENYFRGMSKKDQNIFIIVGIAIAILLFGQFTAGFIPFVHFGHFPFSPFIFIGLLPVIVLLVIIGLIFRPALKGILIAILVIILLSLVLRIAGIVHFMPWLH